MKFVPTMYGALTPSPGSLLLLNATTVLSAETLCYCFFVLPPQDVADCCVREPIHPSLPEVGGGGPELALVSLLCVLCGCGGGGGGGGEEEEGQDSESCGGRFSALSGQRLQHLLPLSGNHTGCYCSRQRWKKREGELAGWWGGGFEGGEGGGLGRWHRRGKKQRGSKVWYAKSGKLKN